MVESRVKDWTEWALGVVRRLRGSRVQRSAGATIALGLGLLFISFNDILFRYLLEPIGFQRGGNSSIWVGIVLVTLGLAVLLIDSALLRQKPVTHDQDKALFGELLGLLTHDGVNRFLNDAHNHYARNETFGLMVRAKAFLEQEENQFVDPALLAARDAMHTELGGLLSFVALHFFDIDGGGFSRLYPEMDPDRTGIDNPFFMGKSIELNAKIDSFDAAYKAFVRAGRNAGMVHRQAQ